MKKYKVLLNFITVSAILLSVLTGCKENGTDLETPVAEKVESVQQEKTVDGEETITIVYTNDVHSYIDNVVKDGDGNVVGDGMRFSKIAAMVNDMKTDGENVLLVDAGDEIQGNIYGAMDEGESIINIMSTAGYQLATPGNHEFDYGMTQFLKLAEEAEFPYVTCNFHPTDNDKRIFSDSHVFEIGGQRVAFVGITTPETIISSTPTYFQNEKGEYIYTIDGLVDKNDLYASVQRAIDDVKNDADYVIAIGHLGVGIDATKKGWDSKSVIANVAGLDAFIDGHSHTVMENEVIMDKDGREVILTQTGSYLESVGVMKISANGNITTELVKDYDKEDETVAKLENDWIADIDARMNEKIAVLENTMYINNPDNAQERLIRSRELNSGDFTSDSIYWFFNERLGLDCDVAIQNGGGIRSEIAAGPVTYLSIKQMSPFGNMICMIAATGQQIVDALEMGSTVTGEWDAEWNIPAENGGFVHAAGLIYTIDSSVPSSVETDDSGLFKAVTGEYRVKDVKVYNRESGEYEPIELDRTYQLAGANYMLRNAGNGLSMFEENKLTVDYVGLDYVILAEYMKSFDCEGEYPLINTSNSPLSKYEGYLYDYDNPYGAGRINIILQ